MAMSHIKGALSLFQCSGDIVISVIIKAAAYLSGVRIKVNKPFDISAFPIVIAAKRIVIKIIAIYGIVTEIFILIGAERKIFRNKFTIIQDNI